MNNKLKTALYFYIDYQLKSKSIFHMGGIPALNKAKDILTNASTNCCITRFKTRNRFLKEVQEYMKIFKLPQDKKKIDYIVTQLIDPFLECCQS